MPKGFVASEAICGSNKHPETIMTTTTFPGPLWFRETIGGALIVIVVIALFVPLALTSGSDQGFLLVVAFTGFGLAIFGISLILLGASTKRKTSAAAPDRRT
jgi:hypothetical protein